jgi:hypothetical protein
VIESKHLTGESKVAMDKLANAMLVMGDQMLAVVQTMKSMNDAFAELAVALHVEDLDIDDANLAEHTEQQNTLWEKQLELSQREAPLHVETTLCTNTVFTSADDRGYTHEVACGGLIPPGGICDRQERHTQGRALLLCQSDALIEDPQHGGVYIGQRGQRRILKGDCPNAHRHTDHKA